MLASHAQTPSRDTALHANTIHLHLHPHPQGRDGGGANVPSAMELSLSLSLIPGQDDQELVS